MTPAQVMAFGGIPKTAEGREFFKNVASRGFLTGVKSGAARTSAFCYTKADAAKSGVMWRLTRCNYSYRVAAAVGDKVAEIYSMPRDRWPPAVAFASLSNGAVWVASAPASEIDLGDLEPHAEGRAVSLFFCETFLRELEAGKA